MDKYERKKKKKCYVVRRDACDGLGLKSFYHSNMPIGSSELQPSERKKNHEINAENTMNERENLFKKKYTQTQRTVPLSSNERRKKSNSIA